MHYAENSKHHEPYGHQGPKKLADKGRPKLLYKEQYRQDTYDNIDNRPLADMTEDRHFA